MADEYDMDDLGELSISAVDADSVVVGISSENRSEVTLALGCDGSYYMLECSPAKARQIAASLLNKADSAEEGTVNARPNS